MTKPKSEWTSTDELAEKYTNDKYPDPEKLAEKIDEYKQECDRTNKKYTPAGLCSFLGYATRGHLSLLRERKDPLYRWLVDKFYLDMEDQKNQGLLKPGQPTAGYIFDLKNVHKDLWKDKQDEESGGVTIVFEGATGFGKVRVDKENDE